MNKLETIGKQHYCELSEIDLYILGYICHHKHEVITMSIYDLAKCCNISHTTILRFCQKLNFEGYSELRLHVKHELKELHLLDDSILLQYAKEYEHMANYMIEHDVEELMKIIHQAKRCFIYYTNEMEQHAALELKRLFLDSQKVFYIVGKKEELHALLLNVNVQDAFIILASKEDEEALQLASNLQHNQISSILIHPTYANQLTPYVTTHIAYQIQETTHGIKNCGILFILVEMLYLNYRLYKQCSTYEEVSSANNNHPL